MLQDFRRVQHLNLGSGGDGLMLAGLYTSLWKHSCARCAVAKAQNLSQHSQSQLLMGQLCCRQAAAGSSRSVLHPSCADSAGARGTWQECSGDKHWPRESTGGWSVGLRGTDGQGEWSTELGVGLGTCMPLAQHHGQGTDRKWSWKMPSKTDKGKI